MSRQRTICRLDELVEALDRRVPRPDSDGEAGISDEAKRLRALAVERLADLRGTLSPEDDRAPRPSEPKI